MIQINSTLVYQIFTFLILMWLMHKFLYKKILDVLDNRTKKVNDSINEALAAKHKATELYDKCVTEFKRVQAESLKIKEQANSIGKTEKERIVSVANTEAESLLNQAKKEIEQELTKAKEELKHEVTNLSLQITEKVIKQQLSDKEKEKITENYIQEIEAL